MQIKPMIRSNICLNSHPIGCKKAVENQDIEGGCDLDYVANKGIEGNIDCAASGSLGFGGHNGVVVFKKIK